MTKMSLRDLILEVDDIDRRIVKVPEWGVELEVRSMSMRARAELFSQGREPGLFYAAMIAASCHDPDTGERVFTESDLEKIADKNAGAIERLAKECLAVAGMGDKAVDEGKDDS